MDKCPNCGENNFTVIQWELYQGEIVDGTLEYSSFKDGGIESVACRECGELIDHSKIELKFVG